MRRPSGPFALQHPRTARSPAPPMFAMHRPAVMALSTGKKPTIQPKRAEPTQQPMTIIRTMTTFCQLATENMVEKLMAEMPMPTIWIQTSLFAAEVLAAAAGLAEVFGDEVEDVGQSSEDDHVSKVGDGNTEHGGEVSSWRPAGPSMKKPAQMKMAAAMSSTVTAGAGFLDSTSRDLFLTRSSSPWPVILGKARPMRSMTTAIRMATILPRARMAMQKLR